MHHSCQPACQALLCDAHPARPWLQSTLQAARQAALAGQRGPSRGVGGRRQRRAARFAPHTCLVLSLQPRLPGGCSARHKPATPRQPQLVAAPSEAAAPNEAITPPAGPTREGSWLQQTTYCTRPVGKQKTACASRDRLPLRRWDSRQQGCADVPTLAPLGLCAKELAPRSAFAEFIRITQLPGSMAVPDAQPLFIRGTLVHTP